MMQKIIVIAEAGVNHNGNFDTAAEMVYAAKAAGADFIKFQNMFVMIHDYLLFNLTAGLFPAALFLCRQLPSDT